MSLYLVEGRDAGFAIKPDGDLVNLHNGSQVRGMGRCLVRAAVDKGATKLDHYDTPALSRLYEEAGFKQIRREAFDKTYAPADWDYGKHGTPDIIYRTLQGE